MRSMFFGKKLVSVPFAPYGDVFAGKNDVLKLIKENITFTIHAIDQMRLESRDITRIEVEEAIKRVGIIAQYEYPEQADIPPTHWMGDICDCRDADIVDAEQN
jgi:hypothetical protein